LLIFLFFQTENIPKKKKLFLKNSLLALISGFLLPVTNLDVVCHKFRFHGDQVSTQISSDMRGTWVAPGQSNQESKIKFDFLAPLSRVVQAEGEN